ncbi:MAG: VWA domain-containing protein [Planctomycetota bacterium]
MSDQHRLLSLPSGSGFPSSLQTNRTATRSSQAGDSYGSFVPAPTDGGTHQVLVLDVSSSMNGPCEPQLKKIDALIRSSINFLNIQARQHKGTKITIVTFNHNAQVLIEDTVDQNGHARLVEAAKSLKASGGTDMIKALKLGGDAFDPNQFGVKQLTLLSDGVHESGGDPCTAADALRQRGIMISAIGFGDNADEHTLRKIASQKNGAPAYWNARDQDTLSSSLVAATQTY